MKIIGKPRFGKWKTRSTCTHCGTRVEFEAKDLKFVVDVRDGDAVIWKCPSCKNENWLRAETVPRQLLPTIKGYK